MKKWIITAIKLLFVAGLMWFVFSGIPFDDRLVYREVGKDDVVAEETIHIVGGGAQNRDLNQMTSDATGRRVVTGPVEATAIGNVMMQAVAAGDVADIAQAREVIKASFDVEEYTPRDTHGWDEAYGRFEELVTR